MTVFIAIIVMHTLSLILILKSTLLLYAAANMTQYTFQSSQIITNFRLVGESLFDQGRLEVFYRYDVFDQCYSVAIRFDTVHNSVYTQYTRKLYVQLVVIF